MLTKAIENNNSDLTEKITCCPRVMSPSSEPPLLASSAWCRCPRCRRHLLVSRRSKTCVVWRRCRRGRSRRATRMSSRSQCKRAQWKNVRFCCKASWTFPELKLKTDFESKLKWENNILSNIFILLLTRPKFFLTLKPKPGIFLNLPSNSYF